MCVSGGKKCLFFGKFGLLCFLETPVLRFALLPYYRRSIALIVVNQTFIKIFQSFKIFCQWLEVLVKISYITKITNLLSKVFFHLNTANVIIKGTFTTTSSNLINMDISAIFYMFYCFTNHCNCALLYSLAKKVFLRNIFLVLYLTDILKKF